MFRDGPERLLVFRVGAERFAMPLAGVDEVIDGPSVQPLPDSSEHLLGVANVRGELVSVYDPRPLLRVDGAVTGAALLFAHRDRRVALAIDDVYDAIVVDESDMLPSRAIDASDGVLIGLVRRGGDLIAVLDTDALLNAAMSAGEGERT
jgi:purine-binding chemotaxis protein CheW